ncbi:MAG TPA: hypothetical protein VLU47_01765 [Blastocatellia bacterium]|nr:hypothetical protein [Blastocatellia bacterium]
MKIMCVITMLVVLSPAAQSQSRTARRSAPRSPVNANQLSVNRAAGQSLPLHRVILYSNGVAYFERRGTVSGHAEVNLPFKESQVNDVLKSMVVLDLGKGRIGAVSYNSSAPPSARLAEIPFSIEAGTDNDSAGGLAAVLKQLQGARATVTTARGAVTGAILTVEERKFQIDANKPPVITHSLVISSDTGELSSFDLAEVRSVRLLDEGARHDVNEFANASALARRRDAKTITVTSDGEGSREMVVIYTVASPIWKTTYRVVMDAAGKPFFQGWAIVDNVSDEDWSAVSLSLVSGTPVSFIQPIQQPMYRYRPVIAIPSDLRLNPQVYEPSEGGAQIDAVGGVADGERKQSIDQLSLQGRRFNQPAKLKPSAPPSPEIGVAIAGEDSGVEAAATGAEVGDLFEYRIDQPITVRRDSSALIPILQTRMEGERVSIYNESVRRDRPMGGMRLKNTSALTLEGGSLTVIDGDAYAGEALLDRLKPGEERFISFALDLGTLVTARSNADREPASQVRVINGVFEAHYYQTDKKTYTITNQTDKPRTLYIEHPIRTGWTLSSDSPKPVSKTASFYRFRVDLEPRKAIELLITENRELVDNYAVSNLTPSQLELFVSRRYIDEATRVALDKIIGIKSQIAAVDARLAGLDRETAEIASDQNRLRENIKVLNEKAEARQLVARYVAKAGEQETRLEQIISERKSAASERARLQTDLDTAIRALALDRKL